MWEEKEKENGKLFRYNKFSSVSIPQREWEKELKNQKKWGEWNSFQLIPSDFSTVERVFVG